MTLAIIVSDRCTKELTEYLQMLQPDLEIQVWPNINNPSAVEYAVLWKQPRKVLANFKNLKAVTSLGAGTDFITNDPDLPVKIPVHRIVTPFLKQQMAQYVLAYVLHDYRELNTYSVQQQNTLWKVNDLPPRIIGFLGLGSIGKFVAEKFLDLGFETIAYTHNSNDEAIACFHGEEGLKHVMEKSDYIVCLLPLTNHTKGLLNKERFAYCTKKPLLIQAGRGEQLVEDDLIQALDKGIIKQAVIDVFAIEPLPKEHVFWSRKDISITPHNSARSDNQQTAQEINQWLKSQINNSSVQP